MPREISSHRRYVFDGTTLLLFVYPLVHWAFFMFLLRQIFHTVNNIKNCIALDFDKIMRDSFHFLKYVSDSYIIKEIKLNSD